MTLASAIAIEEKELKQQKEELLFAYQTLEVGYKRYWEFFNYAPDGYLVTDMEGVIKEVNETILSLLPTPRNQLLNKSISEIFPELKKEIAGLQMDWFSNCHKLEASLYIPESVSIHAAISIVALRNIQNEPVGLLWSIRDITESRELRDNLEYYIMQVNKIQEEERKRIAHDLHEGTLQSLAVLSMHTESIINSKNSKPADIREELIELKKELSSIIEEVRRFSYELRPGELDYLGLTAALETLIADLNRAGISTQLIVDGKERPAAPEKEIALFRIAQEATKNIKKYSQADEAVIAVQYNRNDIKLTVSDNGKGFESPGRLSNLAIAGKLGLIGIEERARLNGGTFSLQSGPEKGTKLTVTLPISERAKIEVK